MSTDSLTGGTFPVEARYAPRYQSTHQMYPDINLPINTHRYQPTHSNNKKYSQLRLTVKLGLLETPLGIHKRKYWVKI